MPEKINEVLAIDVGGSKYIVGVVDINGHVIFSKRETWNSLDSDGIIKQIIYSSKAALERFPHVKKAGMTIPGIADPARGIWVSSPLGKIHDLQIVGIMKRELGIDVYIENDANACALAEKAYGTCQKCKDFLYMTVSTGIGGALFIDGELYTGSKKCAGEIGLTVVKENSDRKNECGECGTLELYAASEGMIQNYIEAGGDEFKSDKGRVTCKDIAELARKGNISAEKAMDAEGKYLAIAIGNANNILDMERVVIGGGLSLAFDCYKKSLYDTLIIYNHQSNPDFSVVPTVLGYEGALIGAATAAFVSFEHGDFQAGLFSFSLQAYGAWCVYSRAGTCLALLFHRTAVI